MEIKRNEVDLMRWDTNNHGQRKECKSFKTNNSIKPRTLIIKKKVRKLYGRPGLEK